MIQVLNAMKIRRHLPLIVSLLSASASWAEMTDNDPRYRVGLEEATNVVEHLGNCCPNSLWDGLNPDTELFKFNYKFPLSDGKNLYLVLDSLGAHTFWYRMILETDNHFELVRLAQPQELQNGGQGISVVSEIFNPTFNPNTNRLVAWDFSFAGDNMIKFIYEYNHGFVLLEQHEDNVLDGKSEYNRVVKY